jgi:phosphomannomutase
MKPLKISISGVRGIPGETLTPEMIAKFAAAFATYTEGGKIYVARDTRISGNMVKYAVLCGLISCGCEVVDLGICPTPVLQFIVANTDASGGIAITASHNSADWNALIFIRSDGIFLNPYEGEELLDIYHNEDFLKVDWRGLKSVKNDTGESIGMYLERLLSRVNVEKIKERRFRVVIDSCNGAAGPLSIALLGRLGCEVIPLNTELSGIFPRPPEPLSENLAQLCTTVKSVKADIGFAQDADGDRLAIVDEHGMPIGEENTLVLLENYWLKHKKRGVVVTNICTTKAVDDIADIYGVKVIRTRVGDVHVMETLKSVNGVIGGEGNGGVAFPEIGYEQDSFCSMAYMLEYLTEENRAVSVIADDVLPKYKIIKRKVECPPEKIYFILEHVKEMYREEEVDLLDGVKVVQDDFWVHIRPSGTEPILRIIAEGKDRSILESVVNSILRKIYEYL